MASGCWKTLAFRNAVDAPAWHGSIVVRRLVVIERTAHAAPAAIEHVGVDHGRGYVAMPKQLLHGANIIAVFEQMGREAVPKRMAGHALGNLGELRGPFHTLLEAAF